MPNKQTRKAAIAEWEAAEKVRCDEIRPLFYFAALQAGLPDDILRGIRDDRWMRYFRNAAAGHLIGSDSYLYHILYLITGRAIGEEASQLPENLDYRGYYESLHIARLGVDVQEIGTGKYNLITNRQNTHQINYGINDDAGADRLSLWYVGKRIPEALQEFAKAAGETVKTSVAVNPSDGIYSCEIDVVPGGYVDRVLAHHARAALVPKGMPDLKQVTLETLKQLKHGDQIAGLYQEKRPARKSRKVQPLTPDE